MRVSELGFGAGLPVPSVVPPVPPEVVTPVNGSKVNGSTTSAGVAQCPSESSSGKAEASEPQQPVRYHRLAEVRIRQGVTRRTMARRMKVDVRTVKREEDPTNDLPLSVLYRWQRALQVPLTELLSDIEEPLSTPVLQRARLLRMMKTARAIQAKTKQASVRYLADMLVSQILEIMPELEGVGPWPLGRRDRSPQVGQIAQHPQKWRLK